MRAATTTAGTSDQETAASDLTRPSPLAWVFLGLIKVYRLTAVARAPRCRFQPTCSSYASESIRVHGAARGGWLALRRIARCHPWNPGGVDHVPPRI